MSDRLGALPLHKLADLREDLDDDLFFSEGELTPAQERRFDAIAGTSDEKVERLGLLACEDVALSVAIEHEEKRLAERRRLVLNRIERRKKYLQLQMQRLGKRQVATARVTVTLVRNSTLSILEPTHAGPQNDLFVRGRTHHRAERGYHVRIS